MNALGIEVSIQTSIQTQYTGRIYAIDDEYNLVVLCRGNETSRDFVFINKSYITEIEVKDPENKLIDPHIPNLNVQEIFQQADLAIQSRASVPHNPAVPEEAQSIFSDLHRTYKCEWEGENIVLVDLNVTIHPPYEGRSDVRGPEAAAERIGEVLVQTRRKLNL